MGLVLVGSSLSARTDADTGPLPLPAPAKGRGTEPTFTVAAGMSGDVFPVLAHQVSLLEPQERVWGTLTVTVVNTGVEALRDRITVQIAGWSDREVQVAEVGAGQTRTLLFAPTFLPRLYRNRELMPATAEVSVTDRGGATVFTGTTLLRMHSAEEMYWGEGLEYAPLVASWVTPRDPLVEEVLARAKEFLPLRRLPGYETGKPQAGLEQSSRAQARAIYRALQARGLSYVKSSGVLASATNRALAERIRLPGQSLRTVSANCIDGVVLYASLLENLGMEPVIVIVPGHAYLGLRLAPNRPDYLYLDTALTGRATFEQAVAAAERGLARQAPKDVIRVAVLDARLAGIYPLPRLGRDEPAASGK